MILLSHGALINPHVIAQLTHKQKMFWFRNLQERTGLIDKREIRRRNNSNFNSVYLEFMHGQIFD